jgi:hypothetical protein
MKYIILSIFSIFIISICFGQTKINRGIIVTILDFAYLEGCETGKGDCKPIQIFRKNRQDSLVLIFPSGGTSSSVYLRSSNDNSIELNDKKSSGQGKPFLNLTNLADGKYSASIMSCGLGGSCSILIKTLE